ncbi:hypothetical protein ACWAT4_28845 [Bradyrhizobium manausense]
MPVDLEWPRRAIVGAIVVIGVARSASSAEGRGEIYFGDLSTTRGKVRRLRYQRKAPSNTGLSLVNSICEAVKTQMRLQASKCEGRSAVEKVRRLRAMSSLCRQQAAYNSMNKWKLLAEAEYWDHLAESELSSYFQQCNAIGANEAEQPQEIANTNDVGPKTISA